MIQGSSNHGAQLKDLEKQVQKSRQLVHQSELRVLAIEASIYEIEKFYPKIKIIRRPDGAGEDRFSFLAEEMLTTAA